MVESEVSNISRAREFYAEFLTSSSGRVNTRSRWLRRTPRVVGPLVLLCAEVLARKYARKRSRRGLYPGRLYREISPLPEEIRDVFKTALQRLKIVKNPDYVDIVVTASAINYLLISSGTPLMRYSF